MPFSNVSALCVIAATVLIGFSLADYDHVCSSRQYFTARVNPRNNCDRLINRMLPQLCGPRGLQISTGVRVYEKRDVSYPMSGSKVYGSTRQRLQSGIPKQVSLDQKDANSILSVAKRPRPAGGSTGFVCECCVNSCKFSELSEYCAPGRRRRRSSRPQITQEDINSFYEEVNSMEHDSGWSDSSSPEEVMLGYIEFEQQPIIRQLERNKATNIALQRARQSAGSNDSELANQKAEYNKLPDYLRANLLRLLAKNETSHSSGNAPHLTAAELVELRRLGELFDSEMEEK